MKIVSIIVRNSSFKKLLANMWWQQIVKKYVLYVNYNIPYYLIFFIDVTNSTSTHSVVVSEDSFSKYQSLNSSE